MKKVYINIMTALVLILTGLACNKKLIENPQSLLTPGFFNTLQGFNAGLDAAYGGMRNLWGTQNLFTLTCLATDEFIRGNDGNSDLTTLSSNYTPNNGTLSGIWNPCYTFINTCNGLIDNGKNLTGVDTATRNRMVAEAKFLRANYYFTLAQFWGDVTLNKNFQSLPTTSASRTPLAEVYKFIIQDLNDAIAVLPKDITSVLPGKANAAAARHLLAKVYLTKASSSAKEGNDYQNAFDLASGLIANKATYKISLLQDFGKVFAEGNESNSEVLWTVQHTPNIPFNGPNNSGGTDNVLNHMWVPQYDIYVPGMVRDLLNGRRYNRAVPTRWLTDTVFAERVNDTRYSKTFQTVWYCNDVASIKKWPSPVPPGVDPSLAGKPKITLGDTACYMPGVDVSDAKIAATRYWVIPPRQYSIQMSPYMSKYNDTKRAEANAPSIRPVIVWTFSETYLIAAEAAFKLGQIPIAVDYINTIRQRAAYPTGNVSAMNITAADLSMDFILDERSRELCGQMVRWFDLIRTGQYEARVKLHNGDARFNIIVPKHLLRPVPQSQIDNTTTGPVYPQNTGW